MRTNRYPLEQFIKLENEPYREGRLIVSLVNGGFSVDVDIVQVEGKKIWQHVGSYFHLPSEKEALEEGVQRLVEYLQKFQ